MEEQVIEDTALRERAHGPSPEQAYRAALAVCSRATHAADAAELLQALGLLDQREAILAQRLAPRSLG